MKSYAKPLIKLAHLKEDYTTGLELHLASLDKERVVADAEAFHKGMKGIPEPSTTLARRHLAKLYPNQYPHWSHLVEPAKQTSSRDKQMGYGELSTTGARQSALAPRGGHHERSTIPANGRGRGRGRGIPKPGQGEVLALESRYVSYKSQGARPARSLPQRGRASSTNMASCASHSAHANNQLPSPIHWHAGSSNQRMKEPNRPVGSRRDAQSSKPWITHEEWEEERTLKTRKQEEEDAARLLEENEMAMFVDLPSDAIRTSSPSTLAEINPGDSVHLPNYPPLQPTRRYPSSVGSSSSPALVAIEGAQAEFTEARAVKELPLVNHSAGKQGKEEVNGKVGASYSFEAPDWRVRGQTEPQSHISTDSSDLLTSSAISEADEDLLPDTVEDITKAWDHVLLGPD